MNSSEIKNLPSHFRPEEKVLNSIGIYTWEELKCLTDKELNQITVRKTCSNHNLNKLRGIAVLICELNISLQDAAILLYIGISSLKTLTKYTPVEILRKIGRLERNLGAADLNAFNYQKIHDLILFAKSKQI